MADYRNRPPIPALPSLSSLKQQSGGVGEAEGQNTILLRRLLANPTVHKSAHFDCGWMCAVTLCTALGLAYVAVADTASNHGNGYTEALAFFWLGMFLIFVPISVRALMQQSTRQERLTLVILLGVALYVVKFLSSPDSFTFIDEYIHLRNTQDVLRTQHLFQFNPLLPTAAYYPGLAAVTAGLVNLTGLSPFASGLIIIGAARILISACFFLVAERVTGSGTAAAGASLVYAANPMFLFWSASFSYENLALPLAAFVVWWLGRTRRETHHLAQIVTAIAIVAVTVTHHVAAFALTALLGAWWFAEHLDQRSRAKPRGVGIMTLVAGSTTLVWLLFVARPAASYLFAGNIFPALQQMGSLLLGNAAPRRLYSGGYAPPAWYVFAGFAAVSLLLLALPSALFRAWNIFFRSRGRVHNKPRWGRPPMVVAIEVAIAFPLTLVPRLTSGGGAISARSSEYVFTGLACVLGLLVEEATRSRRGGLMRQVVRTALAGGRRSLVAAAVVTTIFIGEITIGTAFNQLLPESSHPQGYPWTVQPDVVSASKWARGHLGINQRFAASITDSLALGSYGEQDTVVESSVWPIFVPQTMNKTVVRTIRAARVRYLFVDWRMTKGVPTNPGDFYFSPYEPSSGEYRHPFPAAALRKFDSTTCAHLVYDSGPIQIFDVSRIEDGSCVPRPASGARVKQASP